MLERANGQNRRTREREFEHERKAKGVQQCWVQCRMKAKEIQRKFGEQQQLGLQYSNRVKDAIGSSAESTGPER